MSEQHEPSETTGDLGPDATPEDVLDFWFPDNGHDRELKTHLEFWAWRMRGDADPVITEHYADLTEAAACGRLDYWAQTPYGRLALIIVLDQFSRSVWRNTPAAYSQDIKATGLALEGLENGHYDALENTQQHSK